MHAIGAAVAVMEPLRPDADLLPEPVARAMAHLLEQGGLVVAVVAEWRVAALPGQGGEPGVDVLRLERSAQHRIGLRLGRIHRLAQRPGRLPQLEGAALPRAGGPGVVEPAGIEHLRHQPGRVEAAQRRLHMRAIGDADGADVPVAPGLFVDPAAGVGAVRPVGEVLHEAALGAVAAAAILQHHGVTASVAGRRQRRAVAGGGVGERDLGVPGGGPAIGCSFQDHRPRPGAGWQVNVGREPHAVAHGRHFGAHGASVLRCPCASVWNWARQCQHAQARRCLALRQVRRAPPRDGSALDPPGPARAFARRAERPLDPMIWALRAKRCRS